MKFLAAALVLCITAVASCVPVQARDIDGRWAQSPNKEWFDNLKSKAKVGCCSNADGFRIEDPDWEIVKDKYRVKLNGIWTDVPESTIVEEKNVVGYAMVWPFFNEDEQVWTIRCFMPGNGA